VMIDTLLRNRDKAEASTILDTLHLNSGRPYAVVTLHRPSNVDDPVMLDRIMTVLEEIGREMPVVFPVHPRTRARLNGVTSSKSVILENGPDAVAENANFKDLTPGLMLIDPLGYLDFLKLMAHARIVLTDSGGIQEETTILGTPCLTLRENTERPITVEMGTNRLVGSEPERIMRAYREVVGGEMMSGGPPPLWDGQAAQRIAAVICDKLRKPA